MTTTTRAACQPAPLFDFQVFLPCAGVVEEVATTAAVKVQPNHGTMAFLEVVNCSRFSLFTLLLHSTALHHEAPRPCYLMELHLGQVQFVLCGGFLAAQQDFLVVVLSTFVVILTGPLTNSCMSLAPFMTTTSCRWVTSTS